MEAECQRLQMEHRDQIESINVKTQIQIDKLQPQLDEILQEKERLEQELEDARKERESLESCIKFKEAKNTKL